MTQRTTRYQQRTNQPEAAGSYQQKEEKVVKGSRRFLDETYNAEAEYRKKLEQRLNESAAAQKAAASENSAGREEGSRQQASSQAGQEARKNAAQPASEAAPARSRSAQQGGTQAPARSRSAQQSGTQAPARSRNAQQGGTQAQARTRSAQQGGTQAQARNRSAQQNGSQAPARSRSAQQGGTQAQARSRNAQQSGSQAQARNRSAQQNGSQAQARSRSAQQGGTQAPARTRSAQQGGTQAQAGKRVTQVRPEQMTKRTDAVSRQAAAARNARAARKVAGGKNRKPESRKVFSRSFKKVFLICWGVFVVLIIAAMFILSSFLKRYENGLPEHYMNQILEQIEKGDLSGLHLTTEDGVSIDDPSLLASADNVAAYLQKKNEEEPLRYVKVNSESTDTENVFSIRSGDDKLLKIYLDREGSGSKESSWTERQTQMTADKLQVSQITVQIPSANSLVINGNVIDKSFVTEAGAQIKILENLMNQGFIGPQPTVDTYTVRGIFASPEVLMTDASGKQEPCSLINDVYVAGFEADEAFVSEQTARVLSLFDQYARYFSGDAGTGALSAVMLDNSPAYRNAAAADVSWMQAHDGITLSEETVENFKYYSDECYSCDIHFKEDILQGGSSVRTWDTNMTWIMVKDGDYYIADLITKNAED